MQVTALGPVPVKGLPSPVEVYELIGAGAARSRLQAAAARGLTRFVGRDAELEQLRRALEHARRRATARSSPLVGRAGVGKSAWSRSSPTRTAPRAGWCWRAARSPTARRPPTCRSSTCSRPTSRSRTATTTATIREKVTGKLLTLDRALRADPAGAAGPARRARRGRRTGRRSTRRSAASGRSTRVKRLLLRESQVQPLLWSSRTCTGSTPRPRRCSTAWSRACRPPGSCCWSTTGPSTSTAGAARPTTPSCGSTRCRPRAPSELLARPAGRRPERSSRSSGC